MSLATSRSKASSSSTIISLSHSSKNIDNNINSSSSSSGISNFNNNSSNGDSNNSSSNLTININNGSNLNDSIDNNAQQQPIKSFLRNQPTGQYLNMKKRIEAARALSNRSDGGEDPTLTVDNKTSADNFNGTGTLNSSSVADSRIKWRHHEKNYGRRGRRLDNSTDVVNIKYDDTGNDLKVRGVAGDSGGGGGGGVSDSGGGGGGGGVVSEGYIHELREDILHPLVDSTNPRLNAVCQVKGDGKDGISKDPNGGGIPLWAVKSCEKVRARKYFSPSEYTVAVHMWTHTFLGWSFFRGMYNAGVYADVERRLVPNMECPATFSGGEI